MSNTTKFEVGMMVSCRTTYRNFTGRIVKEYGQLFQRPGDSFKVLNFSDGKEYEVSEFSM